MDRGGGAATPLQQAVQRLEHAQAQLDEFNKLFARRKELEQRVKDEKQNVMNVMNGKTPSVKAPKGEAGKRNMLGSADEEHECGKCGAVKPGDQMKRPFARRKTWECASGCDATAEDLLEDEDDDAGLGE